MSFESAITIILTALGVMLAIVTLGIAGLAIWGYFGIRDSVKEMGTKKVDEAIAGPREVPRCCRYVAYARQIARTG